MRLFDFLFLKIYKFYFGYKEKGAASSAAGIVGGLQAANILTALMICSFYFDENGSFNKIIAVLVAVIFQITTYVRYIYKENNTVEIISKKWLDKNEKFKNIFNVSSVVYIVASIVLFFGLAIYFGSNR